MTVDMETPRDGVGVCSREEVIPLHSPKEEDRDTDEGDEEEEKEEDENDDGCFLNEMGDEKDDDGREKRGTWASKCDYIMSYFGYSVGLNNIWRFPYLCYKHGGGAFLVPYFIMLFFVGIPLFLLEVSMSQFCSQSGVTLYSVCPALVGSGYASLMTNLVVHSYYSMLLTYPLMFIYYSFSKELPWGSCHNSWNTDNCYLVSSVNATDREERKHLVSSADEFFHRNILNISDGIGENGEVVWNVFGTNILVWIIVFLCIFQGIRITGKIVWFTAAFPIVMLLILLVRGVTLPGAADGLRFYLYPNLDKLYDGQVWAAAATQILFSLGPGWSSVLTMGSYNKFNNNCLKDAIMLPIMCCGASILAGSVVFSVLGFMAHEMDTTVDHVTAAGPALVFVTYPLAISMMPMPQLWSVLFFLMLFFVGLDSLFVSTEASIASLLDRFPKYRKWRLFITIAVLFAMFVMGFGCVQQSGMYVLQLMDWYSSCLSLICVCMCELFIFSYSYGVGRTIRDLQMMTKQHVNYYWYVSFLVVTPSIMMVVLINQMINFAPSSYRGVVFPKWAQVVGWVLAIIPTSMIPIFIVVYLCRAKGSFAQRIVTGFTPKAIWGPADPKIRSEWEEYCHQHPLRHRLLHPDFSKVSSAPECRPLSREVQPAYV